MTDLAVGSDSVIGVQGPPLDWRSRPYQITPRSSSPVDQLSVTGIVELAAAPTDVLAIVALSAPEVGTTGSDAAAGPVPFAFVAVTMKRYSVLFVSPLTVHVVPVAGVGEQVFPPGADMTL